MIREDQQTKPGGIVSEPLDLPTDPGTVVHIGIDYGLYLLGEDGQWYSYLNGLHWTPKGFRTLIEQSPWAHAVTVVLRGSRPGKDDE